jgi:hypothetical protein|nr:MAG TPA: Trimerization motif protein [Caudoviricetes sp.]
MNKYAEKMLKLVDAETELQSIIDDMKNKREEVKSLRASIAPTERRIGELEMDIWDLGEQYIVARRKVEGLKGVKP